MLVPSIFFIILKVFGSFPIFIENWDLPNIFQSQNSQNLLTNGYVCVASVFHGRHFSGTPQQKANSKMWGRK